MRENGQVEGAESREFERADGGNIRGRGLADDADRRVRRTERLLKQAFRELVAEKGFAAVTVRDIAERADVNRGTFYAHYPDKYALLDLAIREKLRMLLDARLGPDAGWRRRDLRLAIAVVLVHFEDVYGGCRRRESLNPMFEQAVQQELAALFQRWLDALPVSPEAWSVPTPSIASMAGWAVFGAANEWGRGPKTVPLEEMAGRMLAVLEGGAAALTPGGLQD